MAETLYRRPRWLARLSGFVAVVCVLALLGFAGLGAWSIAHLPWGTFTNRVVAAVQSETAPPPVDSSSTRAPTPSPTSDQAADGVADGVEGAAQTFPPPPAPYRVNGHLITDPWWEVPPVPVYPEAALGGRAFAAGVEGGSVVLNCEVLSTGQPGACEIISETPKGWGFGDAALAGARHARLRPRSIDGFATDAMVRFRVRFKLDQTERQANPG